MDLNDLRLLLYVVNYGGFTAASKALAIPTSTISQRIANLERAAGTGLLRRSTRSLSLTEAGRILLPHARAIEDQARQAKNALLGLGSEMTGSLRVSCSVSIAQFALAPLLDKFLRQNPKITMRLDVTNRYVDLIGEGYDVGLRGHSVPLKDSSLLQRIISRTPWSLAASPDFLKKNPAPAGPIGLAASQVLYFSPANVEPIWTLRKGELAIKVELSPRVSSEDMATLKIAAANGSGIVGLPTYILSPALKSGDLVPVLPDWQLTGSSISTLTPPARQSSHLTKSFTDFLAAELPMVIGG
ncbi:MAG: Transcriptional regulator, LysR family protein [Rhizobium sp.]|nr:Transcriptional regulator, LysR family protein [Rhizobium sp.]